MSHKRTDLHKTPKVKDQLLAFSVRPSVVNPADSCPGSKEATESGIAKTALSPAPACRVHTQSELSQRRNQYFHLPEKFSNSIRQNCLLSCLTRAEQCWTEWGTNCTVVNILYAWYRSIYWDSVSPGMYIFDHR